MPSSSRPYQSKVLRFVLRQWQQGVERQNQAWRQLQSTTVWGAQVAIFPIYAIMRAVKRARFTLGGSTTARQDRSTTPISNTKIQVTNIDHSLTAILSHTQKLLDSEQTAQLIVTPKNSIIHKPKSLLFTVIEQVEKRLPISLQIFRQSTAITKNQRGQLISHHKTQQGGLTTIDFVGMNPRGSTSLLQNGTTLASSLQTRHLILVNPSNETFDIFTPKQQQDLKHYINCVMTAYRQSRTITHRPTKQLSVKAVLVISGVFLQALPGELKKAWTQITLSPQSELTLPPINRNNDPRPLARIFYPQTKENTVKVRQLPNNIRQNIPRLSSNAPDAFEANVNDTSYLQHPLERILRWIDRILTWCEHRWQEWLESRANIG
ncbi:MAG: hypothetical protein F6K11_30995 [Leptolyngbya sp. SIO3F4]|nr:hypothetical protein [Leptolyngbya sp. SIO3F4]